MELWTWLRIAPLAAAWLWIAWRFARGRELRVLLPLSLVTALAARHLATPPPELGGLLEFLVHPDATGLAMGAIADLLGIALAILSCRDLHERNRAERLQWDTMETLRRLTEFFSASGGTLDARITGLLSRGREELGMEIGVLTARRGDECLVEAIAATAEFGFGSGDLIDAEATFSQATSAAGGVLCIENAAQGTFARHPAREIHGFECYVGVSVRVDDTLYGTLFFASREPRDHRFTGVEKTLVELMGHWVSAALERSPHHRDKRQLVPRRSDEIAPRRLDLHWALERLVDELQHRPEGAVAIDLDAEDDRLQLPLYRYEFDRVMESLVHHAAEMAPNLPLRIESRPVSAPPREEGTPPVRYAELAVHASGAALDADALDRLFSSDAPAGPARADGARLLALRHVEHLLRNAGGDLSVRSEGEGGTTFTAFFPAGDAP